MCRRSAARSGSPQEVACGLSSAVHARFCDVHPPAETMMVAAWPCDPAPTVWIEAVIAAPDAS
jgi:hypothetical protein